MKINKKAFEFFNSVSAVLSISLTKKPIRIGTLMNLRAEEDSKIKEIKFDNYEIFENGNFRKLTLEEESMIVFEDAPEISIVGESLFDRDLKKFTVSHKKKNGKWSVKELVKAVEKTEKKTRQHTEWFGGVDVHHIYFVFP